MAAIWRDLERYPDLLRYCLGDLVGYGTSPNEVVIFIREQSVPAIMGNYNQGVGLDSGDCGCAYRTPEAQALGERSIAWSNARTTAESKMSTGMKTGLRPVWRRFSTRCTPICWLAATRICRTIACFPARAGYVVLTVGDGVLDVAFERVDYDVEAAATAIEASDMPSEFAAMLRSGTG